MRKMSIAREIRIQRLQDKNRMVGKTFNPSGITAQQCDDREKKFIDEWKAKTKEERKLYWETVKEMQKAWQGSYPWEWCTFERHFAHRNEICC